MTSHYFPALYGKSSTGKIKKWTISVHTDDFVGGTAKHPARICIKYWYVGGEAVQEKVRNITKGKNIGKANETSPYEQAKLEAESKWKKQIDKGYTEDPSGETDKLLPMLAHQFEKNLKKVTYPCIMQPKLNGVRCLAEKVDDNTIVLHSRQAKTFDGLNHLRELLLKKLNVGEVFDGELYVHEWTFQRIISAVKDPKNPDNALIQYWVYDMPRISGEKNPLFTRRLTEVERRLIGVSDGQGFFRYHEQNSSLRAISSMYALGQENIYSQHDFLVQEHHFEGIIVRNLQSEYRFGFRSRDLLKYKQFVDEEYTIIGATEDADGGVVWACTTPAGGTFSVRPKGTLEQRQEWCANWKVFIGRQLTVRYQNLSEDGIPIFPVGLGVRDYE